MLMLINEQIKMEKVKVVGDYGLSEMTIKEAMSMAEDKGLDLILVNEEKGISKFGDYSKMLYQQKKAKKNCEKTAETKEVQLTPNIAVHDLETKAKMINRLLKGKNARVKISMKFKGRLNVFAEQGRQLMSDFVIQNGWKLVKPIENKDNISFCIVSKEE